MTTDTSLSAKALKEALDRGEVGFILDLRNRDEFEAWRVEGRMPIQTLNIPQPDFVGEEDRHLHHFPRNRKILTVCARGDASKYSAEYLREHGFDALSLSGGMEAWSELYVTRKVSEAPLVFQVNRVVRGCLGHVIISEGKAVVIDASRHLDTVHRILATHKAELSRVIDTHLHADHISGGRDLAENLGAQYCINPADAAGVTYAFTTLDDAEEFSIGPIS